MKVTKRSETLESALLDPEVTLEDATRYVVHTLHLIQELTPSPVIWSDSESTPANAAQERQRQEWSLELRRHFHNMRRRAAAHCPESLLPKFEEQLIEIEATLRAAVTGRLSPFVQLSDHISQVEEFQRRWTPYIDPPPPRIRCNDTDRSVWLDGRCIAKELDRKHFGFIRALARAYPDPLTWNRIINSGSGLRGGNQTRFMHNLPRDLKKYVESGSDGYVLRLPARLSTAV
jgi:hypothetical protein